jgi:DNA replication licensing factor MCM4
MDVDSSPDSAAGRASPNGSSSSASPPTPRRVLVDAEAPPADGEAVPATPVNPTQEFSQSPRTPLSPLIGLEDVEDDVDQADDESAPPQDDEDEDEDDLDQDDADVLVTARGTDVNVRVAGTTFRDFLRNFKSVRASRGNRAPDGQEDDDSLSDSDEEADSDRPLYLSKLEDILQQTAPSSLDIDAMHLFHHNEASQRLYHQLVHYPMELIPLMDLVVQREARRLAQVEDDDVAAHVPLIQVRPYNLKEVSNLRCLDPIAMDSLVCLKGMIVRTSPIIPDLKVAHFSCVICGNEHQASIERGRIEEPQRCASCNTKNTFQLVHNRSLFADKQLVRLQETPDQVPPGQTPASVVTFCYDNLVDTCQPGDKVEVTGVLRAQPVRVNPKISKLKSIYKTYVDVIHFRAITGMDRDDQGGAASAKLSPERIQHLKRLAAKPDIYDVLTKSLAPSIWELDNVKKGVLCMLFGGNNRRVKNNGDRNEEEKDDSDTEDEIHNDEASASSGDDSKLNKRGDINILLCGDPGTSKSQLLSYVHKLSSRGIYTSGKGSSAVGLTASVVRDPETRDLVLER